MLASFRQDLKDVEAGAREALIRLCVNAAVALRLDVPEHSDKGQEEVVPALNSKGKRGRRQVWRRRGGCIAWGGQQTGPHLLNVPDDGLVLLVKHDDLKVGRCVAERDKGEGRESGVRRSKAAVQGDSGEPTQKRPRRRCCQTHDAR